MDTAFPLVEALVIEVLQGLDHDAGTSTPESFTRVFHRVTRAGGTDDGITDDALVDVETFAPRRLEAAEAAEDARQAMIACAGRNYAGALVDSSRTSAGPSWIDFRNPAVQRYVATYRITLRRERN